MDTISKEKNNYEIFTEKLTEKEENIIEKNLENLFSPISEDISDLDKSKKFIEEHLQFSSLIKKQIIIDKMENPDNYINIDETINNIDNLKNDINSIGNGEFVLSLLGKCFEKKV